MPRIFRILVFAVVTFSLAHNSAAQVQNSYLAEVNKIWQVGTCNCYIIYLSIWEHYSDQKTTTSSRLHEFQFINGTECKDLKESGSIQNMELPMELKKLGPNQQIVLSSIEDQALLRLEEFMDSQSVENSYTQNYKSIAVRTELLQSTDSGEQKSILVSLMSHHPDKEEKHQLADFLIFPLNGNASQ